MGILLFCLQRYYGRLAPRFIEMPLRIDPENLSAVILIAAIRSQLNDETLLDAALSEIMSLSLEERSHRDPKQNVEDVLCSYHIAQVFHLLHTVYLVILTILFLQRVTI